MWQLGSPPILARACRHGRVLPGLLLLLAVGTVMAGGMAARYGRGWPRRLWWLRPPGIVLHHSASPGSEGGTPVDVALIDRWHEQRGWGAETRAGTYHVGYHYVILPDGTVEAGRPEWLPGAHTRGHNDCLGVCLIGNFSSADNPAGRVQPARPTPRQLAALDKLLRRLLRRYHLTPAAVRRHCDLAPTACPGDRFPFEAVVQRLQREQ